MSDLKGTLKTAASLSEIDVKTTDKFPAYIFYGLDAIQPLNSKINFGISSGFYSTGGRNHYADYSGFYRDDILVNSLNLGVLFSYKGALNQEMFCNFQLASGIKFSNIKFQNELKVFDYQNSSSDDFRSEGWWIEPQFRIEKEISKNFAISAFVAYEYNLKSKITSKENGLYQLSPKIDWSGFRSGLSFSYIMNH